MRTPGKVEIIKPVSGDSLRLFVGSHYIGSIGNSDDSAETIKEYTEYIVTACNCHDELVRTLGRIMDELPSNRDWLDPDLERFAKTLLKEAKEAK